MNTKKFAAPILIGLLMGCAENNPEPEDITPEVIEETLVTVSATGVTASIDENPAAGDEIDVVEATISEGVAAFEIISQTPAGALAIDGDLGTLTVADADVFDFEVNESITADVRVSVGEVSDTVTVTVNVNNIAETIALDSVGIELAENTLNGVEVYTLAGTTDFGTINYEIVTEDHEAFSISSSGVITVAATHLLDYEGNEMVGLSKAVLPKPVEVEPLVFVITIRATNATDFDLSVETDITISMTDVEGDDAVEERLNAGQTPEQVYEVNNNYASTMIGKSYMGGQIATFNTSDGSGLILASTQTTGKTYLEAMSFVDELTLGGYDDWTLPTEDQSELLCSNASLFYPGANEFLWTSTTCGGTCVRYFNFGTSSCGSGGSPSSSQYDVRPVRVYGTPAPKEGEGEAGEEGEGGVVIEEGAGEVKGR